MNTKCSVCGSDKAVMTLILYSPNKVMSFCDQHADEFFVKSVDEFKRRNSERLEIV